MRPILETFDLSIAAPGGRSLIAGLSMRLSNERVALIGRNGVGKSTLLTTLAEENDPHVALRGRRHSVAQTLPVEGQSHGEARRAALERARASGAELLLLDEPTEDLDDEGVAWLRSWLARWSGCALVATHDRRLLEDFTHFFVVSESGCRYVQGSLAELEDELDREHTTRERQYAAHLQRLVAAEERAIHVARRKERKKRYGRCSELDRATPRILLNAKRSQAQVSHGRIAKLREERMANLREWTKSTRRALRVDLTPSLVIRPELGRASKVIELRGVEGLDLSLSRDRVGVVGPNGAGKTTLLCTMLGQRTASSGTAWRDASKIGAIEQGGTNWMRDESLGELLEHLPDLGKLLVAHRFPLALAHRPLRSLSPGERARAALLCILANAPPVEMLVLDEPTFSLDLVGQRAMAEALRAWPGGLVVASHDRAFLERIELDFSLELGGLQETADPVATSDRPHRHLGEVWNERSRKLRDLGRRSGGKAR